MKSKGCNPTVISYGSMIDGLKKINRLDEAYMLFEEAKARGQELNVIIHISLIIGFGKVSRIDETYMIMEELMQKSLAPNVYTWNCFLDALLKAEEVRETLICFQSMKDETTNHFTYSIMINGLGRVNNFRQGFRSLARDAEERPETDYTTMVSGLDKAGNMADTDRLFDKLKAIEGLSSANRATDAAF